MSVVAAPTPGFAGAPGGSFFALVTSVRTAMFSPKVNCLFLEVLSGSVTPGAEVELVRPDGTSTTVVAKLLREAIANTVLDLADPHPTRTDLGEVFVARTPGMAAPSLSAPGAGTEPLLGAIRAARAADFPVEAAQPVGPVVAPTPEALCDLLRRLPDEAIGLLVQKRVRDALGHHANPFDVMPAAKAAAMHLSAIGLREDGDRLLLTIAAAVQGHPPVALRAAATVGAIGTLATEAIPEAGLDMGRKLGWAIGIEMGDAFATAFQSNVAIGGEVVETALLAEGRAIGIGWCKSCHDVVQLTFRRSGLTGSRQLHCPNDDRKVDEAVFAVPSDAEEAQAALRIQKR